MSQRMEVREKRWWTYFRTGWGKTLGARSDSHECVSRAEEERDGERKAAGQKTTVLMSRGGSSYITEGQVKEPTTHGYFQQTEPPAEDPLRRSHRHIHRTERSPTHGHAQAVCLLVLLFQSGQLCDSQRWHLSGKRPLIGSRQIAQLPFHLSITTITSQGSRVVWWILTFKAYVQLLFLTSCSQWKGKI